MSSFSCKNIPVAILDEWLALNNLSVPAARDSYPIILETTLPFSFTLLPKAHKLRSTRIEDGPMAMPLSVFPITRIYFPRGIPANTLTMPLIILKIPLVYDIPMQQTIGFQASVEAAEKILTATPLVEPSPMVLVPLKLAVVVVTVAVDFECHSFALAIVIQSTIVDISFRPNSQYISTCIFGNQMFN